MEGCDTLNNGFVNCNSNTVNTNNNRREKSLSIYLFYPCIRFKNKKKNVRVSQHGGWLFCIKWDSSVSDNFAALCIMQGTSNTVNDLICWELDCLFFLYKPRAVPLVSQCCYIIHIVVGMETMKHDTATAGQKEKRKEKAVTSCSPLLDRSGMKITITRRTKKSNSSKSLYLIKTTTTAIRPRDPQHHNPKTNAGKTNNCRGGRWKSNGFPEVHLFNPVPAM